MDPASRPVSLGYLNIGIPAGKLDTAYARKSVGRFCRTAHLEFQELPAVSCQGGVLAGGCGPAGQKAERFA
jgi:hypothetical protein